MFLSFLSLQAANEALNLINAYYGFPDGNGTEYWDIPVKAVNQDLWFIRKPPKQELLETLVYHELLESISQYFPIDEK